MTGSPMKTKADFDPSPALRWLLAALSFAAGVIHLVMVPQHAQEALRAGLAFAFAPYRIAHLPQSYRLLVSPNHRECRP